MKPKNLYINQKTSSIIFHKTDKKVKVSKSHIIDTWTAFVHGVSNRR